jgi:hypothetical protein
MIRRATTSFTVPQAPLRAGKTACSQRLSYFPTFRSRCGILYVPAPGSELQGLSGESSRRQFQAGRTAVIPIIYEPHFLPGM